MQPNRVAYLCCSWLCPQWLREWSATASDSERTSTMQRAAAWPRSERLRHLTTPGLVMNNSAICNIAGISHPQLKHVHSTSRFNESVPYFIAVDELHSAVVISVRGTLSLDDTMTDLMCHPEPFEAWSNSLDHVEAAPCPLQSATPPGQAAGCEGGAALDSLASAGASGHSGMMRLAAGLIKDLAEHRVLFDLLQEPPGSPPGVAGCARVLSCSAMSL